MTLRDLIKEYRGTHGLSQRQFATACGLSNGYISMLEKNLNPKTGLPLIPSLPALKKIASGMNMTLNELFQRAEDIPVDLISLEAPKTTWGDIEAAGTTWDDVDGITWAVAESAQENSQRLTAAFNRMNAAGQQEAVQRAEEMAELPKYQRQEDEE